MLNEIVFSAGFIKSYKRRIRNNPKLSAKFDQRYSLFQKGKRDYPLNDHALGGKLVGKRSFSISGDCRVVYEVAGDVITFLDVGTHNQVY